MFEKNGVQEKSEYKKTFVLGIKIAIDNQSFYSFEMR
jgi:hypothetical protein